MKRRNPVWIVVKPSLHVEDVLGYIKTNLILLQDETVAVFFHGSNPDCAETKSIQEWCDKEDWKVVEDLTGSEASVTILYGDRSDHPEYFSRAKNNLIIVQKLVIHK